MRGALQGVRRLSGEGQRGRCVRFRRRAVAARRARRIDRAHSLRSPALSVRFTTRLNVFCISLNISQYDNPLYQSNQGVVLNIIFSV